MRGKGKGAHAAGAHRVCPARACAAGRIRRYNMLRTAAVRRARVAEAVMRVRRLTATCTAGG